MNENFKRNCRKGISVLLLLPFMCGLVPGITATAQEARSIARDSGPAASRLLTAPVAKTISQNVIASLANLPEADTILYLSPRLILSDAAARVIPEKELTEMREGMTQLKSGVGVDLGQIDYIVFQVRFRKPNANLDFSLPEYMMVAGGDFGAEALIQFAKNAAKENLHDESYGSKTLNVMTIDEIAKQAVKTPLLNSLSEVAAVALNGSTIAVGSKGYVKAAIDAVDGKNRISTDLLNSVLRDPTALASVAGSPGTAFAKTFALLGTENNPRTARCDSKLGDFYAAITMDATSFKFRGAMNADNPDTAKIFKSLLSTLLQQAAIMSKDKNAEAILSRLVITPTDTEVLVQAEVSQQAVADFIREQAAPKQQEVTTPPVKPAETKKPTHRRRHRTTRKTTT